MNTSNIDALATAAEKASAEMHLKMHHEESSDKTSTHKHESAAAADDAKEKEKDASVDAQEHEYTRTVTGSPKPAASASQVQVDTALTQRPRSVSDSASSSKRKPTFPDRLHALLSNRSLNEIIDWLPSGKSFCILNKDEFTAKVLPAYFKETKFASFARRLKRWGFRRIYTTGQKQIVLSHDLFQKDRLDLGKMMTAGQQQQEEHGSKMKEGNGIITKNKANGNSHNSVDAVPQDQLQMMPPHRASLNIPPAAHPSAAAVAAAAALQPHVQPSLAMNHVRDHGNITRNGLYPPANNIAMMHPSFRARPAPYMPEREAVAVNELTALEQEIQDCQEQLVILHRLRALRERRRVLG